MEEENIIQPLAEDASDNSAEALQTSDQVKPEPVRYASIQEVIDALKVVAADASNVTRQELDALKQVFYKLSKQEQDAAYQKYINEGNDPDGYKPQANPFEDEFKGLMNTIKESRAAAQEALEAFRQENYVRKLALLDKLKELVAVASTENVPAGSFRELSQEWKEIREIPADKSAELWKSYQQLSEQFYDIQRLNNEFREYDFKKNLEIKIKLCEQVEALADNDDIVEAARTLQKLHQEFRETGPVSKELREEIWNRFKAASTLVNKKHQDFFEERKKQEQDNIDQKTVICEIIEGIEYDTLVRLQAWNEKTNQVLVLQEKWKTIGFISPKQNNKLFERYRKACDEFFKRKTEFFKQIKDDMGQNLKRKEELCSQAEALKDSTEWKDTAQRIADLQKEWKEIGPVPKKHSNAIWERFVSACNSFYEKRDAAQSSHRSEESANLKQKKEILAKLQAYDPTTVSEADIADIQSLLSQWNSIGHVPYKLKDSLAAEYKKLKDSLETALGLRGRNRGRDNKQQSHSGQGSTLDKLKKQYEDLVNQIKTYENNLGFLNVSKSKGNSLVTSIIEKIDDLKEQAAKLKSQIAEMIKQEPDKQA